MVHLVPKKMVVCAKTFIGDKDCQQKPHQSLWFKKTILKSTNELLLSSSSNKHSSSSFGVPEFEVGDEHQESTSEDSRHLQMPKAHLKRNSHKCQKVSL